MCIHTKKHLPLSSLVLHTLLTKTKVLGRDNTNTDYFMVTALWEGSLIGH